MEREYFKTRFTDHPSRDLVWAHITKYLEKFWALGESAAVLELGTGYGSWIRAVKAPQKHALDRHPDLPQLLSERGVHGVQAHVGDCSDLSNFKDESVDLVLASNLLEHLVYDDVIKTIDEIKRVLKKRGLLCLIQPNFTLNPRHYFDDFTHRTIFTNVSLPDCLESRGLETVRVWKKFLPLTMKAKGTSCLTFLVPFYLRSPFKPLAGQMCVIARKNA